MGNALRSAVAAQRAAIAKAEEEEQARLQERRAQEK